MLRRPCWIDIGELEWWWAQASLRETEVLQLQQQFQLQQQQQAEEGRCRACWWSENFVDEIDAEGVRGGRL
eukprot:12094409-Alexandrium_andersonii.AAC.1